MNKRWLRPPIPTLALMAAGSALMLLCRLVPGFARAWRALFLRPVAGLLSRLTARVPFPIAEPLAIAALTCLAAGLIFSLWRCFLLQKSRPMLHYLRGVLRLFAMLLAMYAAMWYPAYWCKEAYAPRATQSQLEALCETLIDRLNAAPADFPGTEAALALALRAASTYAGQVLPEGTVKAVRYPEWMREMDVAGMYAPWTGEAMVDAGLSPAALPFTACHELMHLLGVADEGAANIAAYEACRAAGGALAVSADLWALRYAMAELRAEDESAWRACTSRMSGSLVELFGDMNGFTPTSPHSGGPTDALLRALGIRDFLCDYSALAHRLAIDIAGAS